MFNGPQDHQGVSGALVVNSEISGRLGFWHRTFIPFMLYPPSVCVLSVTM
jgi:hypothetical protein